MERRLPPSGRLRRGAALLVAAALFGGCGLPAPPPASGPATATAPADGTSPGASPVVTGGTPPTHRIGIRKARGTAEFFDRASGARFVVRGANDHHLAVGPDGLVADRTFAPGSYDGAAAEADLRAMRELGYTAVRTALDICQDDCIGDPAGGLRSAYLANVADFLRRAEAVGLPVLLETNDLPKLGGYVPRVEATCCGTFDGYMNSQYFSPVGLAVYREYWTDVIHGLRDAGAPLGAILAYGLRGEVWYFADKPPFSLTSGVVTTANGRTYDMANRNDRSRMVTDGIRFWLAEMRKAILAVDPDALVTAGVFAPNTPNRWRPANDTRTVPVAGVFDGSDIDFLDIHPYPGYVPLAALMQNFGVTGKEKFPVVMGEYGAFKFAFDSPAAGASGLMSWQVASCRYGVDGWFHWHYQGTDDQEVWTGTEGDGVINAVLSPRERPDPCRTKSFPFLEEDLARGATVRASRSTSDGRPRLAADGIADTIWQSGAGPTQWIEFDLPARSTLRSVRLTVAQYPNGSTRHVVLVGPSAESLRAVHTFSGTTRDGNVLTWTPSSPLTGVRVVRILTTRSSSFVAWREIALIGPSGD
ncbi:MAG: discoidin domain-containing protein [Chloroflexi bacterium]|nr:MAG: discoidin domain-containing protein [Chloroflexota bacterium]